MGKRLLPGKACATLFLAGVVALLSCSRLDRARRHLKDSEVEYERAKNALLSGQVSEAQARATSLSQSAERALSLAPEGPVREKAEDQWARAELIEGLFDSPKACIELWFDVMSEGDDEMLLLLFDTERCAALCLSDRMKGMSENEKVLLLNKVRSSLLRSVKKYQELLCAWEIRNVTERIDGSKGEVELDAHVGNVSQHLTFWLHRDDGYWRAHDFTLRAGRLSRVLNDLVASLPEDTRLAEFFENKGMFEAFSEVDAASRADGIFHRKPWMGQYVRLTSPATFVRAGKTVTVDEGRIVKVIDQLRGPQGDSLLTVRTTEADSSSSAVGRISSSQAKRVGSDESEVWGVDTTVNG